MVRELVVKVTCGIDAPERANQGFTVAATAAAAGSPVSLWLTGEAVWLATPERGAELDLPLATPVPDLLATVLELGTVTVCSQCAARRLIDAGPPRAPAYGSRAPRSSSRSACATPRRRWSTDDRIGAAGLIRGARS